MKQKDRCKDIINSLDAMIEFKKTILWGERMELDSFKHSLEELIEYIQGEFAYIRKKLDAKDNKVK